MDQFERALIPLGLTLLAGMATGIGSVIALMFKRVSPGMLRLMMGFSAGVMLYVSFVELLPAATNAKALGFFWGNVAFFGGFAAMAAIDMLVPHEFLAERVPGIGGHAGAHRGVLKAGLLTAVGLMIHNFPEGMAVFASALENPKLGLSLAVAIGLHNIPEGIAVAMPIYVATGRRKPAFLISLFSGLAEPLGALIAALWLLPILNGQVLAAVLAGVGGLMTYISFDELLPMSYQRDHGENAETTLAHEAIIGIVAGMLIMALSLALF